MTRILYIGLFFLWSVCVMAQTTLTHTVEFNRNDFSIVQDLHGDIITSSKHILHYSEDTSLPAIPYVLINILLPDGQTLKSYSFDIEEISSYSENITLSANPKPILTNQSINTINEEPDTIYPIKDYSFSVNLLSENIIGNSRYVCFEVSPISYNAISKTIAWVSSIDLNLTTEKLVENGKENSMNKSRITNDFLKSVLHNPESISNSVEILSTTSTDSIELEYLIITCDSLVNTFRPLAFWKKMKGIETKIITVEDIYQEYSDSTNQLKIKHCIYDHYNQNINSFKYVLLGGDETIIPVQYVYCNMSIDKNPNYNGLIPSDVFYSIFGGRFDWNADGNSIAGETTDGITSYNPNVSIGRFPVSTISQTQILINKTINYEKKPPLDNWYNKMLFAGVSKDIIGDAEGKSMNLFNTFIYPYFNDVDEYNFYDTSTDFEGDSLYDVSKENVKQQISNGYHHIHMMTHGFNFQWALENNESYLDDDAIEQTNPAFTIISTTACHTAAFHEDYRCLAEAFLHNANSGVIAYIGGTKEGVDSKSRYTLGAASIYNGYFYKYLFETSKITLGEALSFSKNTLASKCFGNGNNTYRWTHLSLSLMGDPELRIYTTTPKRIDIEKMSWYFGQGAFTITLPTRECILTISSKSDFGATYFKKFSGEMEYRLTDGIITEENLADYQFCVTSNEKGYIPLHIEDLVNTYIQNKTYTGTNSISRKNIIIGKDVTSLKAEGDVIIERGSTTFNATNSVTIKNGFECKKGATLNIQ